MLTASYVQEYLHQFEPLKHVIVEEENDIIFSPWLVKVHGRVFIDGDVHGFSTHLNLKEFGGSDDLMRLAVNLMRSFDAARGKSV
ncbi:hypothetical protein UFOVP236_77 [uncultured Caudovirales phage]|uniref:Uncharacterized protein n=1 Tax=uncultured Caudovirales phage TaxID=2100421 RepID=A0A6J7WR41_9CAUD|nr:hypothetical protein UFOVP236_77 [uncultured Caudovirales phage]